MLFAKRICASLLARPLKGAPLITKKEVRPAIATAPILPIVAAKAFLVKPAIEITVTAVAIAEIKMPTSIGS